VVAQKGRYKDSQKRKKVVAQKDGYKIATTVLLRRNGGVFSFKISLCIKIKIIINNQTDYFKEKKLLETLNLAHKQLKGKKFQKLRLRLENLPFA